MREVSVLALICSLCVLGAGGCDAVNAPEATSAGVSAAHPRLAERLAVEANDTRCGPSLTRHAAGAGVACPTPSGACKPDEHCCIPRHSSAAPTCVADGTACPAPISKDWDCDSPADCPSGQVCCGRGNAAFAACRAVVSRFHGTHCSAACAATELVVCAANDDCPGGACVSGTACAQPIGVCR